MFSLLSTHCTYGPRHNKVFASLDTRKGSWTHMEGFISRVSQYIPLLWYLGYKFIQYTHPASVGKQEL